MSSGTRKGAQGCKKKAEGQERQKEESYFGVRDLFLHSASQFTEPLVRGSEVKRRMGPWQYYFCPLRRLGYIQDLTGKGLQYDSEQEEEVQEGENQLFRDDDYLTSDEEASVVHSAGTKCCPQF